MGDHVKDRLLKSRENTSVTLMMSIDALAGIGAQRGNVWPILEAFKLRLDGTMSNLM